MPLLAKDHLKECIADALGPTAFEMAERVGLAAISTLFDTAREILEAGQSVLIESFFHHGKAEPDLNPLVSMSRAVLLHCTATDDVLIDRYAMRSNELDRHAIHEGSHRLVDLRKYLDTGTTDPVEIPVPSLIIDTTYGFPEPVAVAAWVNQMLKDKEHK